MYHPDLCFSCQLRTLRWQEWQTESPLPLSAPVPNIRPVPESFWALVPSSTTWKRFHCIVNWKTVGMTQNTPQRDILILREHALDLRLNGTANADNELGHWCSWHCPVSGVHLGDFLIQSLRHLFPHSAFQNNLWWDIPPAMCDCRLFPH